MWKPCASHRIICRLRKLIRPIGGVVGGGGKFDLLRRREIREIWEVGNKTYWGDKGNKTYQG